MLINAERTQEQKRTLAYFKKQEASRYLDFGICLEIHPKIPQKAEIWYLMKASGC